MKATSFETRQRAEELTRDAIAIWRQSEREDKLEGIENDPVFNILLTAMAHQANEMDAEIERLKNEVYDDISSMLVPYGVSGAMPATAAVSLVPENGQRTVAVDAGTPFTLSESPFSFLPLLNGTALSVEAGAPVRMDGRRWQMPLSFYAPLNKLSGWTFAISGKSFRDLKLSIEGREVALIKPWELSELPFTEPFSLDSKLYSHSPLYENSMLCLDLFARHNIALFCVRDFELDQPADSLNAVFEFSGIDNDFALTRSSFVPNANILVNAQIGSVDLDGSNPIYRLDEGKALMHLIRPSDDQIFAGKRIIVRRAGADRFNENSLVALLKCLVNKFDSDFYAFKGYSRMEIDDSISKLRMLIGRLQQQLQKQDVPSIKGTYLILKPNEKGEFPSLNQHFLMTDAEACNAVLKQAATFNAPLFAPVQQIALPVPAFSPLLSRDSLMEMARYQMTTNSRIVTPSDVKVFCRTFLLMRYGIAGEMIRSVSVATRPDAGSPTGYSVFADIVLNDNPFILRSLSGKKEAIAMMMEKMLWVRSSGIYPIKLTINIQ